MRRVLILPTLVLILLGIISYLASAGPFSGPLASAGQRPIVVCSIDDIKTLDISSMSWTTDIRAAMGLWEGLATYDPATLEPRPGVATSWDISDGGKTYTFHLRPEARWSDGDPVTAQDFLFAWQRILTPISGAQYQELFYLIQGAQEYYEAMAHVDEQRAKAATNPAISVPPAPSFSIVGVSAPDPHTLILHLKAPCTYFLDLAAFPPFYPLQEKAMKPFYISAERGYDGRWTQPPNLVTNGPYKLTQWKFKQYLLLEPNPFYWDRKNVHCEKLMLTPNKDARSALLAFQTGAVDVLTSVPQEFGDEILAAKAAEQSLPPSQRKWDCVHWRPVFGSYYYIFNCDRPPLTDPRVRKALAMAVNRRDIVEKVTRMGQDPLGVIVPPGIPGYTSPPELPSDVEAAKKLLAEAGYPNGQGLPSIEILYSTDTLIHGRIAQAIAGMWKKNLGVTVTSRGLERGSFSSARQKEHKFDVARAGWYGDYTDPTTWLDLFRSSNGNNDGGYKDPAYDKMLDAAAAEPDPAKRSALLRAAEDYITNTTVPYLPLYQYSDGFLYDESKIKGIDVNVRLLTQFKWIHRAGTN